MKKVKKMIEKFDYWSAIEYMERGIKEGRRRGDYFLELGHLYRGVGEMKKARDYYKKAMELGVKEAEEFERLTEILLGEKEKMEDKNEI